MLIKQTTLKEEFKQFCSFFYLYLKKKVVFWIHWFEKIKDMLVALLIAQRGKYQQSFITTSFFLLVTTIYMAGPIIAENNPLIGQNLDESPFLLVV